MAKPSPTDVTSVLEQINAGEPSALIRLVSLLYDELHALASSQMRGERWDHTLQPTALVHEAYMRLLGNRNIHFESKSHFFSAAAEVMRRILVDHARSRLAQKRGGGRARVPIDDDLVWSLDDSESVIAVDEALGRLKEMDQEKSRIVELRFFAGLGMEEIAAVMDVSVRTVKRKWRFAKAWLHREIGAD